MSMQTYLQLICFNELNPLSQNLVPFKYVEQKMVASRSSKVNDDGKQSNTFSGTRLKKERKAQRLQYHNV